MDHPVLLIVMRYLHIVSAIVAVGGVTFSAFCLRQPAAALPEAQRDQLLGAVRRRFAKLQWLAIAGLVVSGAYNWMLSAVTYKAMGPVGNALIGTKVLLALILFAVVWARGANLIRSDKAAVMINVHLAAIIILLAAVLRYYRLAHVG